MKYEFKTVKASQNIFKGNIFEEHRQIIEDMAKKGYRFICCIPLEQKESGRILSIDLVFEKDE